MQDLLLDLKQMDQVLINHGVKVMMTILIQNKNNSNLIQVNE